MSSGGGGDPPLRQWRQIPRKQSSDPSQQFQQGFTAPSSDLSQQFQQGLDSQSQLVQQSQFQQQTQHQNIQGFTTPSSNPSQQFQQGLDSQSQLVQQSQFQQQMQHQNIQGFTTPSSNPSQQFQQGLDSQSQLVQQSQFQQQTQHQNIQGFTTPSSYPIQQFQQGLVSQSQHQNIQSQQFPSNYEMMNSSSDFPDYNDPSATFGYGNMPFDTFDSGNMPFDVGNFGNTSDTPPTQAVMNVHSQNYDPAHGTSTPMSNSLPLASNAVHNLYGYINPYAAYGGQNPLHDYPNVNSPMPASSSLRSINLNPHLPAMSGLNDARNSRSINVNPRLPASSSLNVARKSMSTKVGLTDHQKQALSYAMAEIGDLDSILAIKEYAKLFADVDKSVLVKKIHEVEKKAQNKGKTPWDRLGQEQDDEKWHNVVVKNKRARVDQREESSSLPVQEDDQLVSRNDIRSIVKEEIRDGVEANVKPKLDRIILLLETKSGDQS